MDLLCPLQTTDREILLKQLKLVAVYMWIIRVNVLRISYALRSNYSFYENWYNNNFIVSVYLWDRAKVGNSNVRFLRMQKYAFSNVPHCKSRNDFLKIVST